MENQFRESQHNRIVAISIAAIVFGMYSIMRISNDVIETAKGNYNEGRDDVILLCATVAMLCTVAYFLVRSYQDTMKSRFEDRHDMLTRLPNRSNIIHKLNKLAKSGERRGALIILKPKRLGSINNSLGRAAGDQVLKACAERLGYLFEKPHFVGMLSPSAFGVFAHGVTSEAGLAALNEELDHVFRLPIEVEGRSLYLSRMTGAIICSDDERSPEKLLQQAELALLDAKNSDSGKMVIFDKALEREYNERDSLENAFLETLELGQLEAWLQPLVTEDGKSLRGFEALARWKHPTKGYISPSIFIPIAEKHKVTEKLGRLIMKNACKLVRPYADLTVSVNITPPHLLQPDFVEQVSEVLNETGLEPRRLELEITESVVLEETELASKRINALKAIGISIALDDFGTGYSGLSYLNRFSVDRVKLDQSFVAEIEKSAAARETIESIVSLAQKRDCQITAEGVETNSQFEFLQNFKGLTYQGFLFSRPIAPPDLASSELVKRMNLDRFKAEEEGGSIGTERPQLITANL